MAEGTLNPLFQMIDKDIKHDWPQSWALGNSGSQLDVTPFTASLRALPSKQFLTQQKIHLSKQWTRRMVAGRISLAKSIFCAFLRWEVCDLTDLQPMWGCIRPRRTGHWSLRSTRFPCCFTCDRLQELHFQCHLMPSQKPREVLINRIHAGLGLRHSPPFC